MPEVAEKSNDYDYYDQSQTGPRYMQAMRRNNPYASNRGVRSDDYDSGENNFLIIYLIILFISDFFQQHHQRTRQF